VPLRTVAGWGWCWPTARNGDNSEFRRRVRCEGLGYARRLTPYDHGCGAWICWDAESVTPWRSVILADAIGRGGFRRVTWREGTKGKMSSRFGHRTCGARAGTNLVDPSQREAVWRSWNGRMARRQRRTLPRPTLPANMSRRQLVRRVKQRWRTERVYEDAKGELGWDHYEGRSFRGWNHHVSMVLGLLRVYRRRSAPGLFPPRPGKTATRKRSASSRRCGRQPGRERALPGFLHHCAPGRRARPGHMVTPMPPVSQTATRWDRLVHMPVNHRRDDSPF